MLILIGIVGEPDGEYLKVTGFKIYDLNIWESSIVSKDEAIDYDIIGLDYSFRDCIYYRIYNSYGLHNYYGLAFFKDNKKEYAETSGLPIFDTSGKLVKNDLIENLLIVDLWELYPVNLSIDLVTGKSSLCAKYNSEYELKTYELEVYEDYSDRLHEFVKNFYGYTEFFDGCFCIGDKAVISKNSKTYIDVILPSNITELHILERDLDNISIVVPANIKLIHVENSFYIPEFKMYVSKDIDISLLLNFLIREADIGGLEVVQPFNYFKITDKDTLEYLSKKNKAFIDKLESSDSLKLPDIIKDSQDLGVKIEMY